MILTEQHILEIKCRVEALITEREGMIAENKQREHLQQSMAFHEDSFMQVAQKIEGWGEHISRLGER